MGPELEGILKVAGEAFIKLLVDAITGGKVEATKDLSAVLPTAVAIKLEGFAEIVAKRKAAGVETTTAVDVEEHVRAAIAKVSQERVGSSKAGTSGWSDAAHGHVTRRFVRAVLADLPTAIRALGTLEAEQKAKGLT